MVPGGSYRNQEQKHLFQVHQNFKKGWGYVFSIIQAGYFWELHSVFTIAYFFYRNWCMVLGHGADPSQWGGCTGRCWIPLRNLMYIWRYVGHLLIKIERNNLSSLQSMHCRKWKICKHLFFSQIQKASSRYHALELLSYTLGWVVRNISPW